MYDEADKEFFDELYQQWALTTKAATHYWMPEAYTDPSGRWKIFAVNQEGERKLVASELSEADADFISGLHGALPELIRRLHDAVDEASAKDEARDMAEAQLGDAWLENMGLRAELHELDIELAKFQKEPR